MSVIIFKKHLKNVAEPTRPICGQNRKAFNSPELILVDSLLDVTCKQCKRTLNAKWHDRNIDLLKIELKDGV